jgi:hypothetical protein
MGYCKLKFNSYVGFMHPKLKVLFSGKNSWFIVLNLKHQELNHFQKERERVIFFIFITGT